MKTKNFIPYTLTFLFFIFNTHYLNAQNDKGKIVFTSQDDETIVESVDQFGMLDNIYVNIFLSEPLSFYYDKYNYTYDFREKRLNYNYALRVYENNDLLGQWLYEMPPEYFTSTVNLHFPLATDQEYKKELYGNMVNSWVNLVRGLDEGKHDIKVTMALLYADIKGKNPPVLAEGSFQLKVNEDKLPAFIDKFKTELPEATMIAPAIEQQILIASDNVIEGAQPIDVIITDVTGDFNYTYDENGNILYRNIVASVVYQLRNGECWVKTGYYTQEHKGYGDFGVMTFARDAEGYSDYEIDCNLVQ